MKKLALLLSIGLSIIFFTLQDKCFADEVNINLLQGYNFISLPMKPIGTYTAGSISTAIKNNGGDIRTVQKCINTSWQTYIPNLPATPDFAMKISEGYAVNVKDACSFNLLGNKIYTHVIDLVPGWNLIGISAKGTGTSNGLGTLTSISLLKEINAQSGKGTVSVTLQKWENGLLKTADLRLEFIESMHFPLFKGIGYLVLSSETTRYSPNRLRVTNITNNKANISWLTDDENVDGKIVYGETALNTTVFDDRQYNIQDDTHYVTLNNLIPNTIYYYDIISNGVLDDNNSNHYNFKTGATVTDGSSYVISGQVKRGSISVGGAIVYLCVEDKNGVGSPGKSAWLSTITDSNGIWNINLSIVRIKDLTSAFIYSNPGDNLVIEVEGATQGRGKKTVDTSQSNTGDILLE